MNEKLRCNQSKVSSWGFICSFNRKSIIVREEAINAIFGGLRPDVENVIFVNGDLDPRQELSVHSVLNNNTFVINIPGTQFCLK